MKNIAIVFPHQLFESSPLIKTCNTLYLVEESLFFKQFNFHKQKIAYHRATMKGYADYLSDQKKTVVYIDAQDELVDIRRLIPYLKSAGVADLHYIDPTDDWLQKRGMATYLGRLILAIYACSPQFFSFKSKAGPFDWNLRQNAC